MAASGGIVLFVGRLERCKGVPVLLQAAGRVRHVLSDVQFVLAGSPHPTLRGEEIRQMVANASLDGCVQVLGHVPHQQLEAWYRRADVCVLPSYYETFCLAALEAMAFGVPVVATSAGALPELVVDGRTGLLVPPGDAEALGGAIIRILQDGELRGRLSAAAQEWALQEFATDRHLEANLRVYRTAIGLNQ